MTPMTTLEAIESGSLLYENLHLTYLNNLSILRQYFPDVAEQLEGVDPGRYTLYKDNEFRYGIAASGKTDGVVLLTDYDTIPRRQNTFLEKIVRRENIFFLGIGICEYLILLADLLNELSTDAYIKIPRIWIVEPEPMWLKVALSFVDLHDFWKRDGIHFAIGETWTDGLVKGEPQFHNTECLIVVNPTRGMSRFTSNLWRALNSVGGNEISFWDDTIPSGFEPVFFANSFFNNINTLRQYEHFYCNELSKPELSDCRQNLFRDKNGVIGVFVETNAGKSFLPVGSNDIATNNILQTFAKEFSINNTYVIVGAGDGRVVKAILDMTNIASRWEGFAIVVYLIEPNQEILKACLSLHDFTRDALSKRLRIFAGENALASLSTYLTNDPQARRPNKYFISNYYSPTDLTEKIEDCFREIHNDELERSKILLKKLTDYYREVSISQWQERFQHEKIKILCITTRQSSFVQYSIRDLVKGFEESGCDCEVVIENDGLSSVTIPYILSQIDKFIPDLIIVINHLRDESREFIPPNIPYVCWIQDPTHNVFDNEEIVTNNFEIIYAISNEWIASLKKIKKFSDVEIDFLPLAVNIELYKPLPRRVKKYDVTYISHMNNRAEILKPPFEISSYAFNQMELKIINADPEKHDLVEKIYRELSQRIYSMSIIQLNMLTCDQHRKRYLAEVSRNWVSHGCAEIFYYLLSFKSRLWMTVEAYIKYHVIKVLVEHGFRVAVWGMNWHEYPDMASIARGPAKNGEMINEIQNDSSISLNNSVKLSFHMKALEIMASKTFMLSRRNRFDLEPLSNHFEEGEEMIYFDTEDDLVEKVAYYLNYPDEMRRITDKAYKKVVERYTYRSVARKIINGCQNRFGMLQVSH